VKIREPATFWTDCALAAWSAWLAAVLLYCAPAPLPTVLGWWIGGFATCALAATAGAVHHGLGHELSPAANRASWRFALLSLVGTGLCLMQVAALVALSGPALSVAPAASFLIAALFAVAALRLEKFSVAMSAYGLGQGLVLVAALAARHTHPTAHLAWLAAAISTSALAAAVQHFRVSPHPHFNHNDLYHLVQAAAQGFFFLGASAK
jgi:hypothetical protein